MDIASRPFLCKAQKYELKTKRQECINNIEGVRRLSLPHSHVVFRSKYNSAKRCSDLNKYFKIFFSSKFCHYGEFHDNIANATIQWINPRINPAFKCVLVIYKMLKSHMLSVWKSHLMTNLIYEEVFDW